MTFVELMVFLKYHYILSPTFFVISAIFFYYYYNKVIRHYEKLILRESVEHNKKKAFAHLLGMMVLINLLMLSYGQLMVIVLIVEMIFFHGFFRLFLID